MIPIESLSREDVIKRLNEYYNKKYYKYDDIYYLYDHGILTAHEFDQVVGVAELGSPDPRLVPNNYNPAENGDVLVEE